MNIIDAIICLVNNTTTHITQHYKNSNRANNAGDALEEYIKDLFADTFGCDDKERVLKQNQVFSYLGNSNNPPDADAIEVKKLQKDSAIALNSSHPKHKLYASNSQISKKCRNAEDWREKDIIYAIGYYKQG